MWIKEYLKHIRNVWRQQNTGKARQIINMATKFQPGQKVLVESIYGNTEQTIRQTIQTIGDEFFGEEEGKVYTFYELDDGRIVNEDRIIPLIEDV